MRLSEGIRFCTDIQHINNSADFFVEITVSELSKDGVYGGNDSIVAFARCYGVSVVIHQLNAPRWEVHAPAPARGKTLHIAYLNEEHYCSVQPLLPDHPLPPLVRCCCSCVSRY